MPISKQAQQARKVMLKRKQQEKIEPPSTEPVDLATQEEGVTLKQLALPETVSTVPKNKLHKRLWFQLALLGAVASPVVLIGLGMIYGKPPAASTANNTNQTPSAPIGQGEVDQLIAENADLRVEIAALRQSLDGKPAPPARAKAKPAPSIPLAASYRRPPSPAYPVARTIPIRQVIPRPVAPPRIIYRERPAPKAQPKPVVQAAPQPVAQSTPQPASQFSLTQNSAFAPKPLEPPQSTPATLPVRRTTPIKITSTPSLNRAQKRPVIPKTFPPQGILVASLTGNLLLDNQQAPDSPESSPSADPAESPESTDMETQSPSLATGLIAPGTTAKAQLVNPITWIPQSSEAIVGQRYLLKLQENLGTLAPKGSTAIAEVTSAEGDFVSLQVVEINRQALPKGAAMVQRNQSPYLQAKLKGQGDSFGSKLLRAGLNVGIDQLRSSDIGDRASSLVSSFAPDRSSNSRAGIYRFDGEVEIFFTGGV